MIQMKWFVGLQQIRPPAKMTGLLFPECQLSANAEEFSLGDLGVQKMRGSSGICERQQKPGYLAFWLQGNIIIIIIIILKKSETKKAQCDDISGNRSNAGILQSSKLCPPFSFFFLN